MMPDHALKPENLTKNQRLVFDLLGKNDFPMTAYAILDELHEDGIKAPPQVYRALESLLEQGLVHRLESLNAFVACRHPGCEGHGIIAFGICETCGKVEEFEADEFLGELSGFAEKNRFAMKSGMIELKGHCAACC